MQKLMKNVDAFRLPVIFFFNRRNKKKNRKVYMKYFGSMFGFILTITGIVIVLSYFAFLLFNSLHGESNTFTQITIANDFGNEYKEANMSDPTNNYTFTGKINIVTWEDIAPSELYDIYNLLQDPKSGINITKLERYVVPMLAVKYNPVHGENKRQLAFFNNCD
jgi:hypothetical protein